MARRRKKKLNCGFIVVVSALLVLVTLITLADYVDFEGAVPTWNEIFAEANLTEQPAPVGEAGEKGLSMHVIDVGQGDSILLKTPSHAILVDAGEEENGPKVAAYLKAQGISSLDYVVATHPHLDHMGGLPYILKRFPVKNVLFSQVPDDLVPTTWSYEDFMKTIVRKKIEPLQAEFGAEYDLGDGVHFTVVGPVAPSEEMNDNSVVLRVTYGNTAFLLTGDCEAAMEKKILETAIPISANVLKLGHHGSNTSTTKPFLAAVNPQFAAISCGADNSYGHPHREIKALLKSKGVASYRTDMDGSIVFASDGKTVWVAGENQEAAS